MSSVKEKSVIELKIGPTFIINSLHESLEKQEFKEKLNQENTAQLIKLLIKADPLELARVFDIINEPFNKKMAELENLSLMFAVNQQPKNINEFVDFFISDKT